METVGFIVTVGILAISFGVQVRGNDGKLLTKLGLKLAIVSDCNVKTIAANISYLTVVIRVERMFIAL